MILCVGEILADMIGSASGGAVTYMCKAGGAPFNVACAAKRFGAEVGFTGSVGDDAIGKFLVEFAEARCFEYCNINIDPKRNTTLAFVDLDESGERSFCFYRKNTADAYLAQVHDEVLNRSDIVVIGSLMLSQEYGAKYAENLIREAHVRGKRVAFDVNYRTDIFPDAAHAFNAYRKIVALTDIVKFSEEEAELFESEPDGIFYDKLVLITYGSNGAEWRYRGKRGRTQSVKVTPVDTTGAGDAFFAAVLTYIDGNKAENINLTEALRFGCIAGALNTLGRGAIDALPSREEIEARL